MAKAADEKDITINILRGMAIFTMVAANTAAEILVPPHPLFVRAYGSFAAPLFILLSGMMVAWTARARNYQWGHFAVRGLLFIAVGALIDVAGGIYLFTTFDVLYLIGLAAPLSYVFMRFNIILRWIIVVLIFALTPMLQQWFGYRDSLIQVPLSAGYEAVSAQIPALIRHYLIDGWFPVFPWLGFSFLGVNLADIRWPAMGRVSFGKNAVTLLGAGTAIAGSVIFWFFPGKLLIRCGYSELFYPPTIGYLITAVGIILLLFSLVDRRPALAVFRPLQLLGESALFMYLLHLAVIEFILLPLWPESSFSRFFLIYLGEIICYILLGLGLRGIKKKWRNRPYLLRFLMGG